MSAAAQRVGRLSEDGQSLRSICLFPVFILCFYDGVKQTVKMDFTTQIHLHFVDGVCSAGMVLY